MVKLGKAFSDSVVFQRGGRRTHATFGKLWWMGAGRALLFTTTLFLAFFILLWRLFDLTVVQGRRYRVLADNNRIREITRHAPRGILFDRTGKPMVANSVQYRLVKPCEGKSQEACVTYLSQIEGEELSAHLQPGWYVEKDYLRQYLYPESLAHVIGITGELSREELADEYYQLRSYHLGDRIGRNGAEAVFDERLRGHDGRELTETDAEGQAVRTLGIDKETPGEDITLSLDASLSQVVKDAFPQGADGAVVVSKPATGEILALYSSPSFSPNAFTTGMSQSEYNGLISDPSLPLFNRAIGGTYPPGSTFKIVTALAAIEEGAVSASTHIEDVGVITIGPFSFPNWYFTQYGRKEGTVDIVRAIQRSNDIFFYKAGEWLGITKLAAWARKVGVGSPLGIEVSGEASGLMPDPPWKDQYFTLPADREARTNEWYLGDTYHVAIGQGYLLTTPLQVNAWTNVIASGGKLCRPTIGKETRDKRPFGQTQGKQETKNCKDLAIHEETIRLISEGMRKACEPGGTGFPLFNFGVTKKATPSGTFVRVPVACKTGTAEYGDPKERTHAWFTAFAPIPSDDAQPQGLSAEKILTGEPEISVTVLVEGGGEGSYVAAPIAKKIFEEWFSR